MNRHCYINGKIIPENKAGVSVKDIGVLRGYGVFDILRTFNGRPFLLDKHLARFKTSAKQLNLKVPLSDQQITDVINKLLAKNKLKEARIRIVLTGGKSKTGFDYDENNPTLFVLIEDFEKMPKSIFINGAKLITHNYQRDFPETKMMNYQMGIKMSGLKKKHKALEILYINNGKILECVGCNFFIFKGNTLITPKDGILKGTTRNFVLQIANKLFKIEERDIKIGELNSATECFITSIIKDVAPVVKIDTKIIGNGKVGENTKKLMALYNSYTANN